MTHSSLRTFLRMLAVVSLLSLAGCATTPPPDFRLLENAETALRQAEEAGAAEYAPLELRFARERFDAARLQLDGGRMVEARRSADEAEIEAQLALARTRAAQTRADLAQRQRALERLRSDLVEAFGVEVLE